METLAPGWEVDPTALPRGTKVGSWRVYGISGRGTYGTVYRAVAEGRTQVSLAALKLSIHPGDERFAREVELLSRIRHPSVPRLLGAGQWRSPMGVTHPFLVMEWVEGEPLYTWSSRRNPSTRRMQQVLSQAAGALQATHEVGGVHRDVKGGNMLVRPADGRLFLIDFGAGYFAGAARLTPVHLIPGTPHYRSGELWKGGQSVQPDAGFGVLARPSDDVHALGVTAYRLVTDTYPYPPFPWRELKQGGSRAVPVRQLNPRVDEALNALIERMLSVRPEERGRAGELREVLEREVAHGGRQADEPLFEWETRKPFEWTEEEQAEAEYLGHRPRYRNRRKALEVVQAEAAEGAKEEPRALRQERPRKWLPWLAAVLALGVWPGETGSLRSGESPTAALSTSEEERDKVSLGENALSSSAALDKLLDREGIAEELPEQPFSWQLKPDAQGRCPKKQIAVNGGCWAKVGVELEDCPGNGFVYQGSCYVPARASVKVPTSAPRKR